MSTTTYIPEVRWAQRSSTTDPEKNFVYLTLVAPDVPPSNAEISIKPTSVSFKGYSNTLKRAFDITMDLYGEIDPDACKINHTSRFVELKLIKKELKEEYWPRLLKEPKKTHYLKTDFDRWVDEDEQDEAPQEDFSQFGGMGGMGGMGDMGGMGGMPGMGGDFGGIDFSKLGGAGGFGAGDDEGDDAEDDDDDDEMPALEGDEETPAATDAAAAAATPAAAADKAAPVVEEVTEAKA